MKVIIAGGRDFDNKVIFYGAIKSFQDNNGNITEVVCGMAEGADTLGRLWAEFMEIPVKPFPADWVQFGKSAGPRRNKQMAEYADALIAFWDTKSKGTHSMIMQATNRKLKVLIVEY